jgi:hypothetical protein
VYNPEFIVFYFIAKATFAIGHQCMGGWGVFHSFFPVKRRQKGIPVLLREFFFLMFLLVFRPSAGVKKAI